MSKTDEVKPNLDSLTRELTTAREALNAFRADSRNAPGTTQLEAYLCLSVTVANNDIRKANGLKPEYSLI